MRHALRHAVPGGDAGACERACLRAARSRHTCGLERVVRHRSGGGWRLGGNGERHPGGYQRELPVHEPSFDRYEPRGKRVMERAARLARRLLRLADDRYDKRHSAARLSFPRVERGPERIVSFGHGDDGRTAIGDGAVRHGGDHRSHGRAEWRWQDAAIGSRPRNGGFNFWFQPGLRRGYRAGQPAAADAERHGGAGGRPDITAVLRLTRADQCRAAGRFGLGPADADGERSRTAERERQLHGGEGCARALRTGGERAILRGCGARGWLGGDGGFPGGPRGAANGLRNGLRAY